MPLQEIGRMELTIAATPKAGQLVEQAITNASGQLNSETVSRTKHADGCYRYTVRCNNESHLGSFLFSIEKIAGAAVDRCDCI